MSAPSIWIGQNALVYLDDEGTQRLITRASVGGIITVRGDHNNAKPGLHIRYSFTAEWLHVDVPDADQRRVMAWFAQEEIPPLEIVELPFVEQQIAWQAFQQEQRTLITTARVTPAPDEGLNGKEQEEEGL